MSGMVDGSTRRSLRTLKSGFRVLTAMVLLPPASCARMVTSGPDRVT